MAISSILIPIFIFLNAFSLQAYADEANPDTAFVHDAEEFRIHTIAHIERVTRLGLEIRRNFFPDVPENVVREFLKLHDASKVGGLFAPGPEGTMSQRLFEYYGKEIKHLPEPEKTKALLLIQEINGIDTILRNQYLQRRGLLNADGSPTIAAVNLKRIEHIADLVDRYMADVTREEFHRTLMPASEYLNNPDDRRITKIFERPDVYRKLVRGATYHEFLMKAFTCKAGIDRAFKAFSN